MALPAAAQSAASTGPETGDRLRSANESSLAGAGGSPGASDIRNEDIYDAVFDDGSFERLPRLLASAVDGRSAVLHWYSRDSGYQTLGYEFFSAEIMQAYGETWFAVDPWVAAGMQPSRLNKFFLFEEAVSSVVLSKSSFYNDFLRVDGGDTFFGMGAAFSTPWGEGILGVHRGRTATPFEAADLDRLAVYARDVGRILRIRGELASARQEGQTARSALETIGLGVAIVTGEGRLLQANGTAETVLRRADGLLIRAGAISARTQRDVDALHHAIARATATVDPTAGSTPIDRGSDEAPYLVVVSPLIAGARHSALLIFRDPDAEDLSLSARLRSLFGLSKAEAVVAIELSRGRSAAHIASRRGVKANTLKTQLSAVMAKMRCSRQAEVAAIVAALPSLGRVS